MEQRILISYTFQVDYWNLTDYGEPAVGVHTTVQTEVEWSDDVQEANFAVPDALRMAKKLALAATAPSQFTRAHISDYMLTLTFSTPDDDETPWGFDLLWVPHKSCFVLRDEVAAIVSTRRHLSRLRSRTTDHPWMPTLLFLHANKCWDIALNSVPRHYGRIRCAKNELRDILKMRELLEQIFKAEANNYLLYTRTKVDLFSNSLRESYRFVLRSS